MPRLSAASGSGTTRPLSRGGAGEDDKNRTRFTAGPAGSTSTMKSAAAAAAGATTTILSKRDNRQRSSSKGGSKRNKPTWKQKLADSLRTPYQREVLALHQARQEKQEAFFKMMSEDPPPVSTIFLAASTYRGGVGQALTSAHSRRLYQRAKRHQAIHPPKSAAADDGNVIQAQPSLEEEDEDEKEEMKYGDPSIILNLDDCENEQERQRHRKPISHDAWAKRFERDDAYQYPPLQSVEDVGPMLGYRSPYDRKGLRKKIIQDFGCGSAASNEDLRKAYDATLTKWTVDTKARGGAPEAVFDTNILNQLIDQMRLCELDEQRQKDRIFPDIREHIYADLTPARPRMCFACFATILHALPLVYQPAQIGPTYNEIVSKYPRTFGHDAAYFVRWEVLKNEKVIIEGSKDYNLRGAAGTFLPQPLAIMNQLCLQAAQEDERFFPLITSMMNGQALSVLQNLRVSISIISCVEVMCHPLEYIPGRHGLMVLMRDCKGKEFTSWLLPDVVGCLGESKEKALAMLVQKSGYQGKVPMTLWREIAADSRLFRFETSICSLTWHEYCHAVGIEMEGVGEDSGLTIERASAAEMMLPAGGGGAVVAAGVEVKNQ